MALAGFWVLEVCVPVIIPTDVGTNGLVETQQYLFACLELYETG